MYSAKITKDRIKSFCKEKNIKMEDMLLSCELGVNAIRQINDVKGMASFSLAKIADFLDCSVDYLLGRTDYPKMEVEIKDKDLKSPELVQQHKKTIIIPFYRIPASAGTGSWLFDETPVEYTNVPKTEKTSSADFMLEVRGDSMQPKFSDGDRVLVKSSQSIYEGEIGVFILNNESYIKKMGRNELISLNPAYKPIKLHEYDDIRCAGKVLGTLDLQ